MTKDELQTLNAELIEMLIELCGARTASRRRPSYRRGLGHRETRARRA
jgi:hypothetical protein